MKAKIIVAAVCVTLLGAFGVSRASAVSLQAGDSPRYNKGEIINSSVYIAGKTVQVDAIVHGDVFCAGQDVEISGTIDGDVLCAAQNLTITGHVAGDVRLAAQTVTLSGTIDGAATVAAQALDITSAGKIGRDVTFFGETGTMAGDIGRDVAGTADRLLFDGHVGRDVQVAAKQTTLAGKARITGDLTYMSTVNAAVQPGAVISGSTYHQQPPAEPREAHDTIGIRLSGAFFMFSSAFVTGAVVLLAAPRLMRATSKKISAQPWLILGIGLMALVVPPIASLLLLVTTAGMPLAIAILLLWISIMIISLPFGAQAVGRWLTSALKWDAGRWQEALALVLGLLVVCLLSLVPVGGAWVVFIVFVMGLGALGDAAIQQLNGRASTPAAHPSVAAKKE